MRRIVTSQTRPCAIRVGDRRLAVPWIHPDTPSPVRTRILELVLTRQYTYAATLAEIWSEGLGGPRGALDRLERMMGRRPHSDGHADPDPFELLADVGGDGRGATR